MNPYDSNPFENNERRDLRSEADANRALAETINKRFRKELDNDRMPYEFRAGVLVGIAECANDLNVILEEPNLSEWLATK